METQLTFTFDSLGQFETTQTPPKRGRAGHRSKHTNGTKPRQTAAQKPLVVDMARQRQASKWERENMPDGFIPF